MRQRLDPHSEGDLNSTKFHNLLCHVSYSYEFVKCDVRQWKDQLAAFKSAVLNSPHHNIDIVIANAGISGEDTLFKPGTVSGSIRHKASESWLYSKMKETSLPSLTYALSMSTTKVSFTRRNWQCIILTSSLSARTGTDASLLQPALEDILIHQAPRSTKPQNSQWGDWCATWGDQIAWELTSLHLCKLIVLSSIHNTPPKRIDSTNQWCSFVETPLLGWHAQAVKTMLSARGLDFALPEDCVKAAMRISTDTSING